MKKIFFTCFFIAVIANVFPVQAETLEDLYFPPAKDGILSQREKKALAMVRDWRNGKTDGVKPIPSVDGSVRFIYGTSLPLISCAVLQVTDIELEPGEAVQSVHLGDKARWELTPAVTGSGADEIIHIVVKPLQSKLKTSLILTTNRRTYHMTLKSYINTFMPKVSFIYPDNLMEKWMAKKMEEKKVQKVKEDKLKIPGTNQRIDELDFEYDISGNGQWKPIRVYNNGINTIIDMPKKMINGEAPSLLVLRKKTGEEVLANYRIHNTKYIVDTVFDKAILIAGVGRTQEKIVITRKGGK